MAAKKKRTGRAIDARRVVVYDLTDQERAAAQERARKQGRSVSRWIADLVRAELTR